MNTIRGTHVHDGTFYDWTLKFLGETVWIEVRTGTGNNRRVVVKEMRQASKQSTFAELELLIMSALNRAANS